MFLPSLGENPLLPSKEWATVFLSYLEKEESDVHVIAPLFLSFRQAELLPPFLSLAARKMKCTSPTLKGRTIMLLLAEIISIGCHKCQIFKSLIWPLLSFCVWSLSEALLSLWVHKEPLWKWLLITQSKVE